MKCFQKIGGVPTVFYIKRFGHERSCTTLSILKIPLPFIIAHLLRAHILHANKVYDIKYIQRQLFCRVFLAHMSTNLTNLIVLHFNSSVAAKCWSGA